MFAHHGESFLGSHKIHFSFFRSLLFCWRSICLMKSINLSGLDHFHNEIPAQSPGEMCRNKEAGGEEEQGVVQKAPRLLGCPY